MGEGARCPWAKTEHEILYHDTEWCRPCRDDQALFELLELEGFQAGLSWKLILERRAALRAAFADFEPAALAGWGRTRWRPLWPPPASSKQEQGPLRRHQCPGLSGRGGGVGQLCPLPLALGGRRAGGPPAGAAGGHARRGRPVPPGERRPEKRGFRFVGPVIVYSYLQGRGSSTTIW